MKLFARAWVQCNGNASKAAIRVGVAPEHATRQGSRWMADDGVKAECTRVLEATLARFDITTDRVLREVAFGAFLRPGELFDDEGLTVVSPKDWPDHVAATVQSFEVHERAVPGRFVDDDTMASGRRYVEPTTERVYKVKQVDKTAHLTLLMRHLKLLTEHHVHEHKHTLEAIIGESMKPIGASASAAALEHSTQRAITDPQAGGSPSPAPATLDSQLPDVELF